MNKNVSKDMYKRLSKCLSKNMRKGVAVTCVLLVMSSGKASWWDNWTGQVLKSYLLGGIVVAKLTNAVDMQANKLIETTGGQVTSRQMASVRMTSIQTVTGQVVRSQTSSDQMTGDQAALFTSLLFSHDCDLNSSTGICISSRGACKAVQLKGYPISTAWKFNPCVDVNVFNAASCATALEYCFNVLFNPALPCRYRTYNYQLFTGYNASVLIDEVGCVFSGVAPPLTNECTSVTTSAPALARFTGVSVVKDCHFIAFMRTNIEKLFYNIGLTDLECSKKGGVCFFPGENRCSVSRNNDDLNHRYPYEYELCAPIDLTESSCAAVLLACIERFNSSVYDQLSSSLNTFEIWSADGNSCSVSSAISQYSLKACPTRSPEASSTEVITISPTIYTSMVPAASPTGTTITNSPIKISEAGRAGMEFVFLILGTVAVSFLSTFPIL